MQRTIVVEEYDPRWAESFNQLKARIWPAIRHRASSIEHVGSTSVVGLAAKPIIDIDVVIDSPSVLPEVIESLRAIGYEHRGNHGIEGREAFSAGDSSIRHNLYVCLKDAIAYKNHIILRDRLRQDDAARARYSALKMELAARFSNSIDDYVEGKTAFILEILKSEGMRDGSLEEIREANRVK